MAYRFKKKYCDNYANYTPRRCAFGIIYILLLMPAFSTSVSAMQFKGIDPGITSRPQAEKILGKPEAALKDGSYKYITPLKSSVVLAKVSYYDNRVDSIAFPYSEPLPTREQIRILYGLGEPAFARALKGKKRLECYDFPKGTALLMRGDSDKAPVEETIYLSPRQYLIHEAMAKGAPLKRRLGISHRLLNDNEKKRHNISDSATLIEKVYPGTAADKQYIKPGDIILSVNGRKFNNFEEARKLIADGVNKGRVKLLLLQKEGMVDQQYLCEEDPACSAADFCFSKAEQYRKEKRHDAALYELESALLIDPNNIRFQRGKADIYKALNQPKEAVNVLREALKKNPDDRGLMRYFADILFDIGKYDKAATYYEKLLKSDPKDGGVLSQLSRIRARQKKYKEALKLINDALYLKPKDATNVNRKGVWLDWMGKDDEAMTYYKYAAELDPKWDIPHSNMAMIYEQKRQMKKAIAERKKAVELNPSRSNVKALRDTERKPRAGIEKVWVDYDVFEGSGKGKMKGMRIHVKFKTDNLLKEKIYVGAFIEYSDGKPVKSKMKVYRTKDKGQACAYRTITPAYVNAIWKDFTLFFPWKAIDVRKGKYKLKCIVYVYKKVSFARDEFTFDFNRD